MSRSKRKYPHIIEDEKAEKAQSKIKTTPFCHYISILAQAEKGIYPYKTGSKASTEPDLFAAYQIDQRMSPKFTLTDAAGVERVFIVGDGKLRQP
jgi:hypothetical protein